MLTSRSKPSCRAMFLASRLRCLRGVGALLAAVVLSLFPYSAWCLHDRRVMVQPEIQPAVWAVLECGERGSLWSYHFDVDEGARTVYVGQFTLWMPDETWIDLD